MRIVFMGAPDFAVPALERLAADGWELAAVYTPPDRAAGRGRLPAVPPLKRAALELGLDVRQVEGFSDGDAVDALARLAPDAIVVAAYGLMLPSAVLAIPPFGCVNIHPSLLPRHRGPAPIAAAILDGDDETGVSIMLLDEGMDSGPILAQERVAIASDDTLASLGQRLARVGADLLAGTLSRWLSRSLDPQPQPEEGVTYTKLLSKTDGEIDWRLPAVEIERRVRAFNPWPGCYTSWGGRRLKIVKAVPGEGSGAEIGSVVDLGGGEVGVRTGDGVLKVVRLQLEGKREMDAEEFLRGQRGFVGSRLPG